MKQLMFIALALLLAACEKPVLDNEDAVTKKDANVILHFKQYEQESFTRSATDITELCSRLNIAIFDADGAKGERCRLRHCRPDTCPRDIPAGSHRPQR